MENKTVVFFGAGFTAKLGMPTSEEQNKLLSCYFFDTEEKFVREYGNKIGVEIAIEIYNMRSVCIKKHNYDIENLCKYINTFFRKESFTVQGMYNLIDMHIESGRTLRSGDGFTAADAVRIRRGMVVLLQAIFSAYTEKALDDKGNIEKYVDFFGRIAEKLRDDKINVQSDGAKISSENFIIAPISYVSANWDAVFLWSMFIAHKKLNDRNEGYFSYNDKNLKIKVFNDFAVFMAAESVDKSAAERWYPYNESVATRINDEEYAHEKCVTLIKTYLPHGQTNWLECPVCGKLSMYLGDEWSINSKSLPMNSAGRNIYKCVHCGNQLTTADSSMLLQTLHKHKSSYIQEIQTDMKLQIMKSDRIIFIGYSLPDDDVDYRSIFTSLNYGSSPKKAFVVLYDQDQPKGWIGADKINNEKDSNTSATVKRFTNIFGEENVMFNFNGFPDASDDIIDKVFSL